MTVTLIGLLWHFKGSNVPVETAKTIVFAAFLSMCWWNLFNARVYGKNSRVFWKIGRSPMFLIGSCIALLGTIGIVQLGGPVFETVPLGFGTWLSILLPTGLIVLVRELLFKRK